MIHKHWNEHISGICQWISISEVSKCVEIFFSSLGTWNYCSETFVEQFRWRLLKYNVSPDGFSMNDIIDTSGGRGREMQVTMKKTIHRQCFTRLFLVWMIKLIQVHLYHIGESLFNKGHCVYRYVNCQRNLKMALIFVEQVVLKIMKQI